MSLDGRLKEIADEAAAAAVEKIWRLIHAQNLETEDVVRGLEERLSRLESAPAKTSRATPRREGPAT
jgi:hypothetical protein